MKGKDTLKAPTKSSKNIIHFQLKGAEIWAEIFPIINNFNENKKLKDYNTIHISISSGIYAIFNLLYKITSINFVFTLLEEKNFFLQ